MLVTDFGIVTVAMLLDWNALAPMFSTEFPIVTVVRRLL
jgi:hypothetical protein